MPSTLKSCKLLFCLSFLASVVSCDDLSPPEWGTVATHEPTRYDLLTLPPSPDCDDRLAPPAYLSSSHAPDKNCIVSPTASSSSGDTASLWKRSGSYAPCAGYGGDWSHYAAPQHSC